MLWDIIDNNRRIILHETFLSFLNFINMQYNLYCSDKSRFEIQSQVVTSGAN